MMSGLEGNWGQMKILELPVLSHRPTSLLLRLWLAFSLKADRVAHLLSSFRSPDCPVPPSQQRLPPTLLCVFSLKAGRFAVVSHRPSSVPLRLFPAFFRSKPTELLVS